MTQVNGDFDDNVFAKVAFKHAQNVEGGREKH